MTEEDREFIESTKGWVTDRFCSIINRLEAEVIGREGGAMTDPSTLPEDVRRKILAARDALVNLPAPDAIREAYHQLYLIADAETASYDPWAKMEGR